MTWLDLLITETDFVETPKAWITWSGIATIAAIASPNIAVDKGAYVLKPNLFILLMGRSGLGKGFGPHVASKLVKIVNNTKIISGRGTIEGIIKELAATKARENGSIPFKDARGFLCSGEFAASLYESTSALTVLTDLYDAHYNPEWRNTLKNSPIEVLRFPCITLLSGANQDMFDLAIEKHHRTGGFIGRTLLISAEKRYRSNSMIYEEGEEIDEVDFDRLSEHLIKLSKLEGKMKWTKEGIAAYNNWFYPYRELEVDDKTGTYDRLNDHIIKVTTCISLSRKLDMRIEAEDVEDAIALCSSLSNTAIKAAGIGGKSASSGIIKPFLIIMLKAPDYRLTRKQVLQRGVGDFDSIELDKLIQSFTQAGFVTEKMRGNEITYQLTKICIDQWQKGMEKLKNG